MWPANRPDIWVGRTDEMAVFAGAIARLADGEGTVIWLEGEPGIGKSSLAAASLAGVAQAGFEVLWAAGDQLSQRRPLGVMQDCLQIGLRSSDPRRARIAHLLRERRQGQFTTGDSDGVPDADLELLVALVDELCATSRLVLVIDDAHWADGASLAVWHRLALAADQLPLLLVAICRPTPRTAELQELRAVVARRGAHVLSLGPLNDADATTLVTRYLGHAADPMLTQLTDQAIGNPLYLRELVDAVVRDARHAATPPDPSGVTAATHRIPASFIAAVNDRLSIVPAGCADVLRAAALLGATFAVSDLAVLLSRAPSELSGALLDATAAGIVLDTGTRMAFRHGLIHQAIYFGVPAALRVALHREAAMALAAAGTDPLRVAEQLLASGEPGDAAARGWLVRNEANLVALAPEMAVELLRREVDDGLTDHSDPPLIVGLARALLAIGEHAEAATRARQSLGLVRDPQQRAELSWVLVRALFSLGRGDQATEAIRQALDWPELPDAWRARLLCVLAMHERTTTGQMDQADATAQQALRLAELAGDGFATAYALTNLWLTHAIKRDHEGALRRIDRALAVLGEGPAHADLRAFLVDGRIFTLQNLDRWSDAEAMLKHAREIERRIGYAASTSVLTAAVLRYWLGQWDDALAELGPDPGDPTGFTYAGLRETGPVLLWYGVAALIAGRRNQRPLAGRYLRAGQAVPLRTVSDKENIDFLRAAQALATEQQGDVARARDELAAALRREHGEMTLIHQWLPDLVRLSLAAEDPAGARRAVAACQQEAGAERTPARATAAALRCTGLLDNDPEPLHAAVEHYRTVGPTVELAAALEDLATISAARGAEADARVALHEAVALYGSFGAEWDIRRADSRLRPFGIRRGVRGPRPQRRSSGWEALTPTERRVALLIGEGQSTTSIAAGMFLSRRTVQSHISHILTKLGARGRVEIAREAYQHTA